MFGAARNVLEDCPDDNRLVLSMVPSTELMAALMPPEPEPAAPHEAPRGRRSARLHPEPPEPLQRRLPALRMLRAVEGLDASPEWYAWFSSEVVPRCAWGYSANALDELALLGGLLETGRLGFEAVKPLLYMVCCQCEDSRSMEAVVAFLDVAARAGTPRWDNPALQSAIAAACDRASTSAAVCKEVAARLRTVRDPAERLLLVKKAAAAADAEQGAEALVESLLPNMHGGVFGEWATLELLLKRGSEAMLKLVCCWHPYNDDVWRVASRCLTEREDLPRLVLVVAAHIGASVPQTAYLQLKWLIIRAHADAEPALLLEALAALTPRPCPELFHRVFEHAVEMARHPSAMPLPNNWLLPNKWQKRPKEVAHALCMCLDALGPAGKAESTQYLLLLLRHAQAAAPVLAKRTYQAWSTAVEEWSQV